MNHICKIICPIMLAALTLACWAPPEHVEPTNRNANPQSTANGTAQQPATSQSPPAPQSVVQPPGPLPLTTVPTDGKPAPVTAAQPAPTGPAPKLVVPITKIDFGKHPKDKTLTRLVTIRNGGQADLRIEAVEPS